MAQSVGTFFNTLNDLLLLVLGANLVVYWVSVRLCYNISYNVFSCARLCYNTSLDGGVVEVLEARWPKQVSARLH